MFKPKKINQKTKQKKEKDPNKFHFGRNLGSFLIVIGSFLGVLLIYAILWITLLGENSYLKTYKSTKQNPFNDDTRNYIQDKDEEASDTSKFQDITFVEGKDFTAMDVRFECYKYDQDANKATFYVYVTKNDSTPELIPINTSYKTDTSSSTARAYVEVCLTSDWTGFCKYSSATRITKTNIEKTISTTDKATCSVTLDKDIQYPFKTSNWPIPVKVNTPDAYLFLIYRYNDNGVDTNKCYVLHYTYDEYITENTVNAISLK